MCPGCLHATLLLRPLGPTFLHPPLPRSPEHLTSTEYWALGILCPLTRMLSFTLFPTLVFTWHILSVKVQLKHPFSVKLNLTLLRQNSILPSLYTESVLGSRHDGVYCVQFSLICSSVWSQSPQVSGVLYSADHIWMRGRNSGYATRLLSFQERRRSAYFGWHTGRIARGVRSHSKSASKTPYFVRKTRSTLQTKSWNDTCITHWQRM